jgi:hypothetical protein
VTAPFSNFSLPYIEESPDAVANAAPAPTMTVITTALRVLVIDDDPDSALIMQHVLGARGGMDVTARRYSPTSWAPSRHSPFPRSRRGIWS